MLDLHVIDYVTSIATESGRSLASHSAEWVWLARQGWALVNIIIIAKSLKQAQYCMGRGKLSVPGLEKQESVQTGLFPRAVHDADGLSVHLA